VKFLEGSDLATPDHMFQNEVGNLMDAKHDNILQLVGFCCEKERNVVKHDGRYILTDEVASYLLCYESAQSGNLEKYIYGEI
jgi:hypothetical protein